MTSTFLAHRALRIFPALIVEVGLSALLIGFFLTTLPPAAYFSHPQFFRYLGNAAGFVTFYLPGVFESNPTPGVVNANLWTLPAEFYCYLLTAAAMVLGLFYSRWVITGSLIAVGLVFAVLNFMTDFSHTKTTLSPTAIIYYFFVGAMFYHWKDKIPYRWWMFAVSAVAGYAAQMRYDLIYIAPVFITYCTIFVGMTSIPRIPLISKGDYSYGIYLYGFPITQTVVSVVPGMRGHGWQTLFLSAFLTVVFAVVSWHLIEKPMLAYKRKLPKRFFPRARRAVPVEPEARIDMADQPGETAPTSSR